MWLLYLDVIIVISYSLLGKTLYSRFVKNSLIINAQNITQTLTVKIL